MIKMLYLHILQADSTENWNAFCKLIVLDNYKISKKSKKSVLRYIENISSSVGNFVKCMPKDKGKNQLLGNVAAHQRLYFRCIDSALPLLP